PKIGPSHPPQAMSQFLENWRADLFPFQISGPDSVLKSQRRFTMAALDWSQCPAVESVPGKVSGAWVFRGTRMPVATVFAGLGEGMTINELIETYDGLTREHMAAVLEVASRSLGTPA